MALYEEKIVPEEIEKKNNIWFLDSGASNHMTGCRSWFSELNESVTGTVKFGDGSQVEIKGRGDVMLQCENGDHCILSDVYFIPKLKSNIISLGQLDEQDCKIEIEHGLLVIFTKAKELLAKVRQSRNRLYTISLKTTKPTCLLGSCLKTLGCGMLDMGI